MKLPQVAPFSATFNDYPPDDAGICARFRARSLKPHATETVFWQHNPNARFHDFSSPYYPIPASLAPPGCAGRGARLALGHAAQLCVDLYTGGAALGLAVGSALCGHHKGANNLGFIYSLQMGILAGTVGVCVGTAAGIAFTWYVTYPVMLWFVPIA